MVYLDEAHYDYDKYGNVTKLVSFLPYEILSFHDVLGDLISGLRTFDLKENQSKLEGKDENGSYVRIEKDKKKKGIRILSGNVDNEEYTITTLYAVAPKGTPVRFSKNVPMDLQIRFLGYSALPDDDARIVRQEMLMRKGICGKDVILEFGTNYTTYDGLLLKMNQSSYQGKGSLNVYIDNIQNFLGEPRINRSLKAVSYATKDNTPVYKKAGVGYHLVVDHKTMPDVTYYTDEVVGALNDFVFTEKPVIYKK